MSVGCCLGLFCLSADPQFGGSFSSSGKKGAGIHVFRDRPFEWLRYGPVRSREGSPGWTDESNVNVSMDAVLNVEKQLPDGREHPGDDGPIPIDTLANSFAYLEELGLITRNYKLGEEETEEEKKQLTVDVPSVESK